MHTECPTEWSSPFAGAVCIFAYQNQWLFVQNITDDPHGDLWGIPGGKMDAGETPLETVIREMREETGLSLHPKRLTFLRTVYIEPKDRRSYALHAFYTQSDIKPKQIILDSREHQNYAWLSAEEALRQPLLPGSDQLIPLLLQDLAAHG